MTMRAPASVSAITGGEATASRHFAWVRCSASSTLADLADDSQWPEWLAACSQVTPHLQRFGYGAAMLDLGVCADPEAVSVMQELIARLQRQPVSARAAIASSGVLAQVALLRAPVQEPLTLLTSSGTAELLRQAPTAILTHLQFADQAMAPAQALAQAVRRLEGYGVRSLAHLARLNELALRRQFGKRLGVILAAVARGEDPWPFQPTPAPLRLQARLRLTAPLSADCLLASLAPLTLELAAALARRGLQAQRLELRLRWETGTTAHLARTTPQPLVGAHVIEAVARRMLTPILQENAHAETLRFVEDFRLGASQLTPQYPAQDSFWPQRARRLAAVRELTGVLAQRYGKPLLFQSRLTAPDAIFAYERSLLTPILADVADVADVDGAAALLEEQALDTSNSGATEQPGMILHGIHWW